MKTNALTIERGRESMTLTIRERGGHIRVSGKQGRTERWMDYIRGRRGNTGWLGAAHLDKQTANTPTPQQGVLPPNDSHHAPAERTWVILTHHCSCCMEREDTVQGFALLLYKYSTFLVRCFWMCLYRPFCLILTMFVQTSCFSFFTLDKHYSKLFKLNRNVKGVIWHS